jgi:hypothetical protein
VSIGILLFVVEAGEQPVKDALTTDLAFGSGVKAAFCPSAIRTCAPDARHTAPGFYNLVISTNRCERNHGYVKSRIRPMRAD